MKLTTHHICIQKMNCTFESESDKCKMTELTLYDELGPKHKCVQISYGSNLTELVKTIAGLVARKLHI